jgi:SAM-dependent methyltransferase
MTVYDDIGRGYADRRRADPRIAAAIDDALGDAVDIVNVGAGAGSYEPVGRSVIGVEPSALMIGQRSTDAAPCIAGVAEALPLCDKSVDAALAVLTLHHWRDLRGGLVEMRRVARRRAVILTWVPDGPEFWLTRDYFPEILATDRNQFPATDVLASLLERTIGTAELRVLPVPHDCSDGFLGAYWRRPETYLDLAARRAISSFSLFDATDGLAKLRRDLGDGTWHRRNGHLMNLSELDLGYRIAICRIA